jgi:hypothetical protein
MSWEVKKHQQRLIIMSWCVKLYRSSPRSEEELAHFLNASEVRGDMEKTVIHAFSVFVMQLASSNGRRWTMMRPWGRPEVGDVARKVLIR